jgi:carboxymethylenebutenolidase
MAFEEGGQKALLWATTNPKLKAAVIYYGSAPPDDKLAQIQCPVIEFVGDKDARIAPVVPVLQEKMKQLGKSFESKTYPGVDHGFFDETGERYNEAAASDSWTLVLDFLKRNLR